jgi:diguanylate cyclase (GGDEF)-like protein
MDRERMLDMRQRLRRPRVVSVGILAAALVLCGPSLGWWTLVPLALGALAFRISEHGLDDVARPEYRIASAWAFVQVMIAVSIVLTGGPGSPAILWLAVPTVTLPARYGTRGLVAGVLFTAGLMVAVTLGVDPQAVLDNPGELILPASALGGIAVLSTALMSSDREHRSEAVIDPLTAMLNRKALQTRVEELAQQALVTREPIGVVVGDLDAFKRVNDVHGHAKGDAVLQDVAYLMRKTLRAFDLAYRLGGEEFLILLPGADIAHAHEVAERLRAAVGDEPVAGLQITMSFGVNASDGATFDFPALLAEADAALYAAKAAGRNCTCVAGAAAPQISAVA